MGDDGGGADVVDIRPSQCSLPLLMTEANREKPDSPRELPQFDEDAPRPVPDISRQDGATLVRLVGVMRRLLDPDGCPWDREQSFETLRKYVLEEACEVIDAIDSGERAALREELGDLLLQVVFQAELARREGSFAIDDVVAGIVDKLVNRHPHVFGDLEARDADEVLANWEKLKAREKGERGVLAGVPRSMPALTRAQRIGEKVSRVGFDWDEKSGAGVSTASAVTAKTRMVVNNVYVTAVGSAGFWVADSLAAATGHGMYIFEAATPATDIVVGAKLTVQGLAEQYPVAARRSARPSSRTRRSWVT